MATSANRRYTRQQNRLKEKLHKQFLDKIKGKTPEEIQQILEQIRIKYNLEPFNTENYGG